MNDQGRINAGHYAKKGYLGTRLYHKSLFKRYGVLMWVEMFLENPVVLWHWRNTRILKLFPPSLQLKCATQPLESAQFHLRTKNSVFWKCRVVYCNCSGVGNISQWCRRCFASYIEIYQPVYSIIIIIIIIYLIIIIILYLNNNNMHK